MADRSSIEWTEATWTPIRARNLATGKVGWHCEHVSEGCRNCYAESINRRLGTQIAFKPGNLFRQDRVGYSNGEAKVFLDEKMLLAPLKWRRPRRIFVCSMTDLFSDFVSDAMIDRVFAVMALAPQHTFQVLTKRPARMRAYLTDPHRHQRISLVAVDLWLANGGEGRRWQPKPDFVSFIRVDSVDRPNGPWPLPNVWLGASAENQATADARLPELLATPAAVRFVSAEPLLGGIDFQRILLMRAESRAPDVTFDALKGWFGGADADRSRLDWIIVGGESGPRARPMHPAWVRSIRDQCAVAGVPFFMKQWGEMRPYDDDRADCAWFDPNGSFYQEPTSWPTTPEERRVAMVRLGKKAAGRLLDGRTHDAMPEVRHG